MEQRSRRERLLWAQFDALELEAQKVKTSRQASDFIVKHRRA